MNLGFTGTGEVDLTLPQAKQFVTCLFDLTPSEFHMGDCIHADEQAAQLVRKVADWDTYVHYVIHPPINAAKRAFWRGPADVTAVLPAKPYLERNHDIVDATDLLIACPGEDHEVLRSGTWATVRYARKQGKPVWIIYPNGELVKDVIGLTERERWAFTSGPHTLEG